jgi:hypothetical protein
MCVIILSLIEVIKIMHDKQKSVCADKCTFC